MASDKFSPKILDNNKTKKINQRSSVLFLKIAIESKLSGPNWHNIFNEESSSNHVFNINTLVSK